MGEHAIFSPSSSDRWLTCTKSFYLHKGGRPSLEAIEGTAAHNLAAHRLLNPDFDLYSLVGRKIKGLVGTRYPAQSVDQDMVDHVMRYVNFVEELPGPLDEDELQIERRVYVTSDCWGTSDAKSTNGNSLDITDLKFGRGTSVQAENNNQMKIYGLGWLEMMNYPEHIKDVRLHIFQPRISGEDPHRQWEISVDELLEWKRDIVLPTLEKLRNKSDLQFRPSEKACRWCSYAGSCKALAEYANQEAMQTFKDYGDKQIAPVKKQIPDADKLTDQQIADILTAEPLISKWMKSVRAEALSRALSGNEIPGHKVVHANKNRVYKDIKFAEAFLTEHIGDAAFSKKLLSPAQAEKVIKSKKDDSLTEALSELIIKPQGSLMLALDSDKRSAVNIDPAEDFRKYVE